MSILFQAMHAISTLAAQADVHGKVRVSITFDSEADRARFSHEAERQIRAGGLVLCNDRFLNLESATIHGVDLRIV